MDFFQNAFIATFSSKICSFKRYSLALLGAVTTVFFLLTPAFTQAADRSVPTSQAAKTKVSINSANVEKLASTLTGVGPKKAEAIVAYRNAHGKFKSIDQLTEVKGISEKILEKNKGRLSL